MRNVLASLSIAAMAATVMPAKAEVFLVDRDPSLNVSFDAVPIVSGLQRPWSMTWLPDGTMLVTERAGRLRVVRNGVLDPEPVAGVPSVLTADTWGLVFQSGLFEVSAHPDFATNNLIYLTYATGTQGANRLVLARARLDGKRLVDLKEIWANPQTKPEFQHYGGRITWLPDRTLLLTVGDGGNPPVSVDGVTVRTLAQNLGSAFGKVMRLNDDGSVPKDNPFVGRAGALPEIFSYGHRNSQGIVYDAGRGIIWSTEHGPLGADELNIVKAGANYGWPKVTWGSDYVGATEISPIRSQAGMEDPVLLWSRTVGPSGMTVYTGDAFAAWKGSLFTGSLAYQDVRRTWFDASGRVAGHESMRIGQRVRDVRQGPDGLIYVLTDEDTGRLFRIQPPTS